MVGSIWLSPCSALCAYLMHARYAARQSRQVHHTQCVTCQHQLLNRNAPAVVHSKPGADLLKWCTTHDSSQFEHSCIRELCQTPQYNLTWQHDQQVMTGTVVEVTATPGRGGPATNAAVLLTVSGRIATTRSCHSSTRSQMTAHLHLMEQVKMSCYCCIQQQLMTPAL